MGFFDKLKQGLQRTKQLLQTDVRDLFKSGDILDKAMLEQFEARLIRTDIGVAAAEAIIGELEKNHLGRTVVLSEIWETIKQTLRDILRGTDGTVWDPDRPLSPLRMSDGKPTVILVTGVNGTGKTTSIAKISKLLRSQGLSVMLAAGDTFRAAAVEQLTMWSQRLGCPIVTRPSGTDPASVAYAGCEEALAAGVDVLVIDTAGRLHNQINLMKELEKIRRVIDKKVPGAPHECLLVIDATTGQNGLNQAEHFSKAANCTGIVLAKLDGTAKGGVTVAIRQRMGIPVKYVGVGEQIDDLELFDPDRFVDALFDDVGT
jgi:fused signal recognition particle receptor